MNDLKTILLMRSDEMFSDLFALQAIQYNPI